MIEKTVKDHLEDLGVPVCLEVPASPPEKFLVVEKTGSDRSDRLYRAMIVVKSYGKSLLEAATLNESVLACMDTLAEEAEVSACRLNSDYNFTDTASKRYRYQAVFDVYHY